VPNYKAIIGLDLVDEDPLSSTGLGPEIRNMNSVVYQILGSDQEELLVASLKEAAYSGIHSNTLSRILASLPANYRCKY
jgi:hypothetical protein